MKTSTPQNLTDLLGQHVWLTLTSFWGVEETPQPPLYFFLSPRSRGSLRGRSLYEIDLVHRQQYLGEGITLKYPPQAYVSNLSQIPEEVAHLFALTHQTSTIKQQARELKAHPSIHLELWSMTLHECFGKFSSHLVTGKMSTKTPRPKRAMKNSQDLWVFAHQEGYYLAEELLKAYLDEKISRKEIQKWFRMNWYTTKSPAALKFLYKLLKKSPPTKDFA